MAIDNPVVPEVFAEPPPVETIEVRPAPPRRISWGAVIAGVAVALVTQIVLSILGIAIGISTIEPAGTRTRWPEALTTGAGIWWVITGLLSLFIGGLVAGRLAGIPRKSDGVIHGIITYSVTTLISVYLLTTAVGVLVSGAWSLVQSGAVTTAEVNGPAVAGVGAAAAARGFDVDRLRREVQAAVRAHPKYGAAAPLGAPAAGQGADAATEQEVFLAARRYLEPATPDSASREVLVALLANRTAMSRAEADRTVEDWDRVRGGVTGPAVIQGGPAGAQDLTTMTQRTKHAMVATAVWTFIGLVIGVVAAAIGGMIGSSAKALRTGFFSEQPR